MAPKLTSSEELFFLRDISQQKAKLLAPAIAYTVVLMIVGTIGNPIAIYIYGWKWKNTTTRVFLLCLAVLDLINCVITMPTEICLMVDFYYFPSGNFCMISRFVTYFINNATSAVFLFIASDRYFRICRPHGWNFSVSTAKMACAVSLGIGTAVSWPAIVIYGNKTVVLSVRGAGANTSEVLNVTGVLCNVKNGLDGGLMSEMFFNYLWCGFIICLIILSFFYILIGRAILKRWRFKKRMHAAKASPQNDKMQMLLVRTKHALRSASSAPPKDEREGVDVTSSFPQRADSRRQLLTPNKQIKSTPINAKEISVIQISTLIDTSDTPNGKRQEVLDQTMDNYKGVNQKNGDGVQKQILEDEFQALVEEKALNSDQQTCIRADSSSDPIGCVQVNCAAVNTWRTKVPRSTLMLFAITAVFILTFLPFLVIISIRQRVGRGFYQSLTACEELLVHIFSRSYLVNNCANPIVYGLVNVQFRTEVKSMFEGLTRGRKSRDVTSVDGGLPS
ncbi:hypothetical protein BgiMline_035394 [Biomphalaria glabrata]|nr:tachykinin-like peptides receptor 99D [Biomphalaria glabrata]